MPLAHKIIKSSVWVYAANWFTKLVGLSSTLILARLLTPDDFGVVASVAVITSLFHVLSTVGTNSYLLRKESIFHDDLNTAWTISIIMKLIVTFLVLLSANTAANFLGDPRIADVLQVSAFIPLVLSFANIGMVLFEKEMNYKPAFKLNLYIQVITFSCKISLAIIYQNYWVFVIAEFLGAMVKTAGSYYYHPFKPKFSLNNWREQWAFSQWVLARGVFATIRFKIDNIIIAKVFPATALGMYTVAKEIATTPAGQIIEPMLQPLYVGLAKHIKEPKVFADKVHKTMLSAVLIVLPIAFGVSALAQNIVLVLLGDQWLAAIPIIQIIAFIMLSGMLNALVTQILTVLGKTKVSFYLDIVIGSLTILVFVLLAQYLALAQFALLRVAIGLFSFLITISYVKMVTEIKVIRLLMLICPIMLCAVAMYSLVVYCNSLFFNENQPVKLAVGVLVGVFSYTLLAYLTVKCLKQHIHEFDFVWKSLILPILCKLK